MFAGLGIERAAIALVFVSSALAPTAASAISADVAKRCNFLIARQFPPREPGNPAAGSANGSAQSQRAYFSKCVANGGKVDNPPDQNAK